jgi:hypothetical protein
VSQIQRPPIHRQRRFFYGFRQRRMRVAGSGDSEAELAAMYAQAADEDRDLAEAGLADYAASLADEDVR